MNSFRFPLHVELNFDLPQESVVTEAVTALQDNEPSFTELNLNNHPLVNSNHLDQIMAALKDNSYVEHVSLVNLKMVDKHAVVRCFFFFCYIIWPCDLNIRINCCIFLSYSTTYNIKV